MVKHFSHSHLTIICNFVEKFPALSKLHDEVKFGLKEEMKVRNDGMTQNKDNVLTKDI